MTDWFGGKNPPEQIMAGNDLLEPGTKRQWDALIDANKKGILQENTIDRSVKRILTVIFKSKKMKDYERSDNPSLKDHAELAEYAAAEGMVLLKNKKHYRYKRISKTLPCLAFLHMILFLVELDLEM